MESIISRNESLEESECEYLSCLGYLRWMACGLPEGLPALEDILVALLAQLGAEADVVGLFSLVNYILVALKWLK